MLDALEILVTTVEAGSFAAAARRLGLTASAVSRRIANLEAELGVALLARTTRSLRLTDDGQAFHARCAHILEQLREARAALAHAAARPAGTVRVDAPVALGRAVIAQHLPRFLDRHREIRVDLTLRDQFIDPLAEGLDVLVRIGRIGDSPSLIPRRLGTSRIVHCASPSYLRKRGHPRTLDELAHHDAIGYLREGQPAPFVFEHATATRLVASTGHVHVNDGQTIRDLALAGRGIAALFDFLVTDDLAAGRLVEVLPAFPSSAWPIHALYPKNRHLLPKVDAFLTFLAELFGARPRKRR